MIDQLVRQRLMSVVEDASGLIGYRFAGALYDLYEQLDAALVQMLSEECPATPHSCATVLDRAVLDRISFFEKLPSIPFEAVPHKLAQGASPRVLSPSTCYNTFAHLAGTRESWLVRSFTARGRCHRYEPSAADPTRMGAFDMREFVLVGEPDEVVSWCEKLFERGVELIRAVDAGVRVAGASDIFYGARSEATRKVQRALGVKREGLLDWPDGNPVAVCSRNLHRDLFTSTFGIGPLEHAPAMHSSCVAFGLDRMLLVLLARTPGHDVEALSSRVTAAIDGLIEVPA
ncbi:hypothetical protein ABZX66_18460 [Micromonospora aurantiaca]|uniref:hypothetical protein n=1 Tax=Micromonospora aurantiaca (nom. illeg.) TaxID=47850 RepID=UPI0033B6D79B